MAESISITVPNEPHYLSEAANFLEACANFKAGINTNITAPPVEVEVADPEPEQDRKVGAVPEIATGYPDGEELDSEGLPWDARIHSSGKSRLKSDDTWKKLRGVDPELVKQVEAELRAALHPAAPEAATPAPGVQSESMSEATPPPGAAEAVNAAAPAPTPAAPAPAPEPAAETVYLVEDKEWPESALLAAGWNADALATLQKVEPATVVSSVTTFPELMKLWNGSTVEKQTAALQKYNLPSVALAATQPDLIPKLAAELP